MIELADGAIPAQVNRERIGGGVGGAEDNAERVALEHAVGLAAGIVAAALVEQRRDGLGSTFTVANADLHLARHAIRFGVRTIEFFPLFPKLVLEIEDNLVFDQDFVAATIDGRA